MDNKFKFVVELGYQKFEFDDAYETMMFAMKAKESSRSEDLSVTIEIFIVNKNEEPCGEEKNVNEFDSEVEDNEVAEESEDK